MAVSPVGAPGGSTLLAQAPACRGDAAGPLAPPWASRCCCGCWGTMGPPCPPCREGWWCRPWAEGGGASGANCCLPSPHFAPRRRLWRALQTCRAVTSPRGEGQRGRSLVSPLSHSARAGQQRPWGWVPAAPGWVGHHSWAGGTVLPAAWGLGLWSQHAPQRCVCKGLVHRGGRGSPVRVVSARPPCAEGTCCGFTGWLALHLCCWHPQRGPGAGRDGDGPSRGGCTEQARCPLPAPCWGSGEGAVCCGGLVCIPGP